MTAPTLLPSLPHPLGATLLQAILEYYYLITL